MGEMAHHYWAICPRWRNSLRIRYEDIPLCIFSLRKAQRPICHSRAGGIPGMDEGTEMDSR